MYRGVLNWSYVWPDLRYIFSRNLSNGNGCCSFGAWGNVGYNTYPMKCSCPIKGSQGMINFINRVLYKTTGRISGYLCFLCNCSTSLVFLNSFIGGTKSVKVRESIRNLDAKWCCIWTPSPSCRGANRSLGFTACIIACTTEPSFKFTSFPTSKMLRKVLKDLE